MKAIDLKNSILEYAVQGKLVEQFSDEEEANLLLDKIKEEKKLKKSTNITPIDEVEIPFSLPKSWCWTRLEEISNIGNFKSVTKDEIKENSWVLDLKDIESNSGILLNKGLKSQKNVNSNKYVFEKGNVMYGKLRPYLNKVIVANEGGYCTTEILPLNFGSFINNKYAKYVLMSPYFVNYANKCSYGVKMPRLGSKDSKLAMFPLPPLKEQKRIVDKIEELFKKVDQYDVLEEKLSSLNENFPINMEKSILQYAFEGKLVSQDRDDESTLDLIKKIEKKRYELKKKKENKFKSSSKINPEEIPYHIPDTWKWVRISDLVYSKAQKKPDSLFRYIDVASIDNEKGQLKTDPNYLEPAEAPSRARKIVNKGDILYSTIRPYLKNICIFQEDDKHDVIASTAFAVMTPILIENTYIYYFLKSPYFNSYVESKMKGVAYPAINEKDFYSALIPLPPIEEQKRIVNKIEELFFLTNLINSISK